MVLFIKLLVILVNECAIFRSDEVILALNKLKKGKGNLFIVLFETGWICFERLSAELKPVIAPALLLVSFF